MTKPKDRTVSRRMKQMRLKRKAYGWHEVRVWVPTKQDADDLIRIATERRKRAKEIPMTAFSQALALESIPDALKDKFDHVGQCFNGVTHDDLVQMSRTVAYKVGHNIRNGKQLDPKDDPLTYVDCGGGDAKPVVESTEEREDCRQADWDEE